MEIKHATSKLAIVAAIGLSLAGYAVGQGLEQGHGGGNLPGSNPGHGGTPPGNHYGWQKGKHNPHNTPTPTATASPIATATPVTTPTPMPTP
jgi:hypothetical protein